MSGYGYGNSATLRHKKPGAGYDTSASAYFAAVPNAFSTTDKAIFNTLFLALKADGNFAHLDRLVFMANSTSGNSLIDLIDPVGHAAMTAVNAPAFIAYQGYTSDGATSYLNAGFVPGASGVFSQDSSSIGGYARIAAAGANLRIMGAINGGSYLTIIPRYSNDNMYLALNDSEGAGYANINAQGLFSGKRAANNASTYYINGSSVLVTAAASNGAPSVNLYVLASNTANVAGNFTNNQVAVYFVGDGSVDHAKMSTAINTAMTSFGTNVY